MKTIADDKQTNILKEQFIPDNVFVYIANGAICFFDTHKNYIFKTGDCGIARKNYLLKYKLLESKENFDPIIFCFDEPFLVNFQKKYQIKTIDFKGEEPCIKISKTKMIEKFIQSLEPYHKGVMQLDDTFEDLKYEELLLILLKHQPELSGLLFDFEKPGRLNLEAFMNRNFRFNVSVERFAFLTGRSVSAFKRDFAAIFNKTPSRWLVQRRLEEAYFLMNEKKKKPSEIYIDLGFESLSHFSVSFKKQFGIKPTEVNRS
ncbi:helix-turn-helix transcriptional regulator [Flavobacterium sp. ANB]|uniref:helix-turn-helix domain-containing protein n=1 Tax=unclassified Flavobacterium TaxID=196869 RepID=UPI0012B7949F|nr:MULTISPECIES: AraC family transcriptional regulator [unclassified Flavobacterium]MBF4517911.1 helix-turn-helix transcriptional regulator [Flavobacterium sp. ANB]MTD71345.1 helix-turn-helix domain-containing protein [Flavobacterium sp. LC2016-13]